METRAGVGRRIRLAIGVGFALVLVVGGVSVLLARAIAQSVEEGRQRGLEVEALDRIHSLLHHFVDDLHLVLQGRPAPGHSPPEDVLQELKGEIAAYEALEQAQGGHEARQELPRVADLKSLLAQLEAASSAAIAATARGVSPTPTDLAFLDHLAHEQVSGVIQELHALHRLKFQRAIDGSQRRIRLISALYVAFAAIGGLLLLLSDRFLSRTLVRPITKLAEAAHHIAGGHLSRRVPVRADDEVGQLSRAFNRMAERLEAHEAERVHFEAELERQVKERTRQLEETTATLRATQAQLIRSERIAVTGQIAAGVTHEYQGGRPRPRAGHRQAHHGGARGKRLLPEPDRRRRDLYHPPPCRRGGEGGLSGWDTSYAGKSRPGHDAGGVPDADGRRRGPRARDAARELRRCAPAAWRSLLVPTTPAGDQTATVAPREDDSPPPPRRISWAALLRRRTTGEVAARS